MFKDLPEGQTHSYNDGCGEPEHNKKSLSTIIKEAENKLSEKLDELTDGTKLEEMAEHFGVPVSVVAARAFDTMGRDFLTEQITKAYEAGTKDALEEVKESDSIENMFALLEKEKCNPKYIKIDNVGFSRWIEFTTEYQTCWIEWYKNISTLRVGDMYGVRIPFTHIKVNAYSPANKRCLTFVNGQAQPKFGLADINTELTLKKLEWQ